MYLQDENLKDKLRQQAHGEDMWAEYKRLEVGTPSEASSETIKAKMRSATILGSVGFNARSVVAFDNHLSNLNHQIEPAADRMSEHDVCIVLLKAIAATKASTIAADALDEFTRSGNARRFLQAAPNPNHLRDLQATVTHFNRSWEAHVTENLIAPRAAGGKMSSSGDSTHADGHEAIDTEDMAYEMIGFDGYELQDSFFIGDMREAFADAMQSDEGRKMMAKICFCCFGEGHIAKDCPSKRDEGRTLKHMIVMLTALSAKNVRKGQMPYGEVTMTAPKNTAVRRKVPGWWRSRTATNRKPQAYVLQDGSIIDEWGAIVTTLTGTQAQQLHLDQSVIAAASLAHATPVPSKPSLTLTVRNETAHETDQGQSVEEGKGAAEVKPGATVALTAAQLEEVMHDPFAEDVDVVEDDVSNDGESIDDVQQKAPSARTTRKIGKANPLMQMLSCLLLPFCNLQHLTFMSLPVGTDGFAARPIAVRPSAPSRVYSHAAKYPLTSAQVAEDAEWRARGYDIEYSNEGDSMTAACQYMMTADSGATIHCSGNPHDVPLDTADPAPPKVKIRVASGSLCNIDRRGPSMQVVKTRQSGLRECMALARVHYSSAMPRTTRLYSVRCGYEEDGIKSLFNGYDRLVLRNRMTVPFHPDPKRYFFRAVPIAVATAYAVRAEISMTTALVMPANITGAETDDLMLKHARYAHFGHLRTGVRVANCPACMLAGKRYFTKSAARGARKPDRTYTYFGERVSSDMVVGLPPSCKNGFTIALIHYDWATGTVASNYLKSKTLEAIGAGLVQFQKDHQPELFAVGGHVLEWHKDNEITATDSDKFAEHIFTSSTFSIPYDKNTNPGSERAIGIVLRPSRIMAANHTGGGDRFQFWPFLFEQAIGIHNRLKTRKFQYKMSPNEKTQELIDNNPSSLEIAGKRGVRGIPLTHEPRVMLCKCYVAIPPAEKIHRGKLEPTAYEATNLGYDKKRQGIYVLIHPLNRITSVRESNVSYAETSFHHLPTISPNFYFPQDHINPETDEQQPAPPLRPAPTIRVPAVHAIPVGNVPANQVPPGVVPAVPMPQQHNALSAEAMDISSQCEIAEIFRMSPSDPYEVLAAENVTDDKSSTTGKIPLPKDEVDALDKSNPYHEKWREAMLDDIRKKADNGAYEYYLALDVVKRGFRIHGGKWVFRITYDEDGTPHFRARWVFRGFTQEYLKDYDKTFIGGITQIAERTLICKAAWLCLPLYDCDIRAAYTTAQMDRELYVEAPRPFTKPGYCARACMSLEGSKQAGNLYYIEHADCLVNSLRCNRSIVDPNLYSREDSDTMWIYIAVLTDNCLMLPSCLAMLKRFLAEYRKYYTITGGDITTKFNGINIDQSRISEGIISINQKGMIEDYYNKYVPAGTRPRTSPLPKPGKEGVRAFMRQKGAETDEERKAAEDKPYMAVVGCVSYVTHKTRVDCRFHASFLGQFMQNHSIDNWNNLINVLCYLYHTRDFCITFDKRIRAPHLETCKPIFNTQSFIENHGHAAWTDATFGFHMQSAYIITMLNAAIGWASRKIKVAATSAAETETIGGVQGSKADKFTRAIMKFLKMNTTCPTPLLVDNEPMWFNVRNDVVSAETSHWGIWQRFVRQCYLELIIEAFKIDTDDELADLLTKAIPKENEKFMRFTKAIMNMA